jgi:transcriptional regulator with XRE-family HTH domain
MQWPQPQPFREVRLRKGVTQEWLASVAGMSEAYISNMESGFKVPEPRDDRPSRRALDCKVIDVVGAKGLRELLPK